MQKDTKSKKNNLDKLRIVLDRPSDKHLHPEDEKHLKALSKRLKKESREDLIYIKRTPVKDQMKGTDILKPTVMIHRKDEKKTFEFKEAEPEKKTVLHEDVYEIEKVEVEGPEFVEVKPKDIQKEEKTVEKTKEEFEIIEETKEETPSELPEWKPVDIEETKMEKPIEEKAKIKEEAPKTVEKKEEILFETEEEFKIEETHAEEKFVEAQIEAKEESPSIEEKKIPAEEIKEEDLESKINAFKEIETIDEKTAVLLYDHGFTSVDDLKKASLKSLTKIEGIKRKLAKKIKKEIKKKTVETTTITSEIEAETLPSTIEEEISVFKDISCIDQKTAKLLYENGITSVDILKETPIKQLVKIKGIKRKIAKKIKKELKEAAKKAEEKELYAAAEEEWELRELEEHPSEQVLKENPYVKETEEEWEQFYEEKTPEEETEETQVYKHEDYTLYRREMKTKTGKKRFIHFFSKAEPEDAEPIELPQGYEVKVNKKTGVPYLKKKKKK